MELVLNDDDLKSLIAGEVIYKDVPASIGLITIAVVFESKIKKED